jgi:hypothetical protein
MATNGETGLSLIVRYWGADRGNRKFAIYLDDKILISEDNTAKWNQKSFKEVEYAIPDPLIAGKKSVMVKFQALQGNSTSAVYYVRMARKKNI